MTTVKKPIDDEDDKVKWKKSSCRMDRPTEVRLTLLSLQTYQLFPAGRMFVYFGSQTGTAEGFARTIEKEGIARGNVTTTKKSCEASPNISRFPTIVFVQHRGSQVLIDLTFLSQVLTPGELTWMTSIQLSWRKRDSQCF